jgi:hypothetical protein
LFDDAMISLTYGRTLAETGEVVWFPGAPRVQGITNPLWTLYMAALHVLGLEGSGAALAVSITGIVLVLGCAVVVFAIVRRAVGTRGTPVLVAAAAAGTVPFVYPLTFWTVRGMEVGVLALALLVMIWSAPAAGVPGRFGTVICAVAGVIGVLTRLDFVLLAGAVIVWSVADAKGTSAAVRRGLALGGPIAIAAGAVLLLQRLYYGEMLPNTYRLKVEGYTVAERVTRGVVSLGKSLPVLIGVALAVVVIVALGTAASRRTARMMGTSVGVGAAYGVWVGGDAWEGFLMTGRYLSVVLPLAVALVFIAVGLLLDQPRAYPAPRVRIALAGIPVAAVAAGMVSNPYRFHIRFAAFMVAIAAACAAALAVSLRVRARASPGDRPSVVLAGVAVCLIALTSAYPLIQWVRSDALHIADDQDKTEEGLAIADATSPNAVVAVTWAGALAYHADRDMVDLLGKNDPVVAAAEPIGSLYPGHNKWDFEYSIGQLRPDIVFQVWNRSRPVSDQLPGWGYELQCLTLGDGQQVAAWFLSSSEHIRWDRTVECGRERRVP